MHVVKVKNDSQSQVPVGAYGLKVSDHQALVKVQYFGFGYQLEDRTDLMELEEGVKTLFPIGTEVKVERPRLGTPAEFNFHGWDWDENEAHYDMTNATGRVTGSDRGIVYVYGEEVKGKPFPFSLPFFPDELERKP